MGDLTRAEIQERIDGISATLKGPNIDRLTRLLLNEDRKDLRRMLDALESARAEDQSYEVDRS